MKLIQEMDASGALEHCKYNLAISCPQCNQVCKKAVEKINLQKHEPIEKCPGECLDICKKYNDIRKEYIKKNAIILQPYGIDSLGESAIIYNISKHIYEPNDDIKDEGSIFLIQNHIDRFKLNGDRFSPIIIDLCVRIVGYIEAGVTDANNIFLLLDLEKPENVLGIDFITYLKDMFRGASSYEIGKFCRMIVLLDAF